LARSACACSPAAVELLVVFIALEISSISTYILAGYRKNTARGPEAAIKYFLLGSFATGFLLYGIALIFGATGTTQIYEASRLIAAAPDRTFVVAGLGLMLIGILFKVSAAPFHLWTPDVYEGAPTPAVALMSTAPKAAAFALLLRVVYELFPTLHALWQPLLWAVAVLSMTVGNLAALRQQNVKRMLAYSSIAHAGYLLAAFAGFGTSGIAAAAFYTAAYAAMNVGIFAVVTLVSGYDEAHSMVEDYRGLIYRAPILGSLLDLFPGLTGGNSLHRRLLRQVLFLLRCRQRRSSCARHHRPAQLRPGCGLLPPPRPHRRAAARGLGRSKAVLLLKLASLSGQLCFLLSRLL
jgi:NADH-quinone oxidoreductase subunit N